MMFKVLSYPMSIRRTMSYCWATFLQIQTASPTGVIHWVSNPHSSTMLPDRWPFRTQTTSAYTNAQRANIMAKPGRSILCVYSISPPGRRQLFRTIFPSGPNSVRSREGVQAVLQPAKRERSNRSNRSNVARFNTATTGESLPAVKPAIDARRSLS